MRQVQNNHQERQSLGQEESRALLQVLPHRDSDVSVEPQQVLDEGTRNHETLRMPKKLRHIPVKRTNQRSDSGSVPVNLTVGLFGGCFKRRLDEERLDVIFKIACIKSEIESLRGFIRERVSSR